ncbi:MAG TPA: aminotransferase class I/II-fold pyridoxal phosphate-dependent enzyme, partial [Ktedonobacterales bacterium]|nr:aminotransferase class I/II-fold pyridoxal phosphate-dependent enzyme [Ktedonobacterales bacterium]
MRKVTIRPEIAHIEAYTPGESLEAFSARTGRPVADLIKLNSNESPYPPSPRVAAALGSYVNFNRYPDGNDHALLEALSQYIGVPANHIITTCGSNDLITLLCRAFLAPGETVVTSTPNYSFYATTVLAVGGNVIGVPRKDEFAIDVQAILDAIQPDSKIIILCSPNNPTGNLVSRADVETLLATGCIVVIDEVYLEFAGDEAMADSFVHMVPSHDNLVVLRSFSKWAGLAGLRSGFGICPLWLLPSLRKLQLPFAVNLAAQIASRETLADLPLMRQRIAEVVAQRERLWDMCQRYSFLHAFPSRGNFLLLELTDERYSIAQFREQMEAHNILLRYFSSPDLSRHVRIT